MRRWDDDLRFIALPGLRQRLQHLGGNKEGSLLGPETSPPKFGNFHTHTHTWRHDVCSCSGSLLFFQQCRAVCLGYQGIRFFEIQRIHLVPSRWLCSMNFVLFCRQCRTQGGINSRWNRPTRKLIALFLFDLQAVLTRVSEIMSPQMCCNTRCCFWHQLLA